MRIEGSWQGTVRVTWEPLAPTAPETWADLPEAVEHASYGVAALLLEKLTNLRVLARSAKGTGFDYWVGDPSRAQFLFQGRQRLEVSGILRDAARLASRVTSKTRQAYRSGTRLALIIVVVEYSTPESRMLRQ
jgi:hypothetical protein